MAKSEKEEVNKWVKRLDRARRLRDKEKERQGWDRILEEYQGIYNLGKTKNDIKIAPINMVYGYVHTELPKLYSRDPYISVNAKGMEYIQRSHIIEAAINYLWQELHLKYENFKTLMDTLLIGHGWMKYGYTGKFGHIDVPKKAGKNDSLVLEVNEFVKDEEIFGVHVSWDEILFDPMAKDPPYDCRWIAHRIIRPLDAVKESEMYENTSGLKSNISLKDKKDDELKDSDIDLVEMWEVHDKDSNQILTLATNHEKFLQKKENNLEMEGLPFSMLKFNRVPGKPYPLSDIFLIEPQILQRIKLRATQINHIRRWNRQLAVEKGAMENSEMQKFEDGVDGGIIQYTKGYAAPVPIQYAPMQAEIFALDSLIQSDSDAVIGQNEVERGGEAKTKTRTLGELRTQLNGTSGRAARRQDALEDFLEEVAKKIIQLMKQFQDTEKYVRITGKTPAQIVQALKGTPGFDGTGLTFTKADIQGEYDVDVKAGSTLPMNKENRLKFLEVILQLGPGIGIIPNGPVAMAVGREILRELEIKEAEKAFDEQEAAILQKQSLPQMPPGVPMGPGPAPGPTGPPQMGPPPPQPVPNGAPLGMPPPV